jgi:diketogulonate reductase-like aldo/keto reductase
MTNFDKRSTVKLHNGVLMPIIGLGTWKLEEGPEVENAVKLALDAGYRMFDTAMIYKNEEGVGKALNAYGLLREEFFVTTKLWNTDQGYENTLKAIDVSLEKLGLAYVDLYLVHWPTASDDVKISSNKREDTWRAMEEIYKSGKAKAIGVSNFTITHLDEMKKYATIMPMVNQVEFNPFLYQEKLLNYCHQNNIVLEAYSPLVRGKRLQDEKLENIAQKYNKTVAQLMLRWSIQHGLVVIPKSTHKERIEENINIFDFEITAEDMKIIDLMDENMRLASDPTELL